MSARFADRTTGERSLHLPLPRLVETSFHAGSRRIDVLTDDALANACGTRVAFTGRRGGVSTAPYKSLNLGDHVGDELRDVEENRALVAEALGGSGAAERLVVPKQVHGTHIVVADDVEQARCEAREGADGIVCCEPDIAVLLCFADCVPVIVVAPDGSFAVAHAGWRGAVAGIPELAVKSLVERSGASPETCNAYIGPHVGACCYEVSDELLGRFCATFGSACEADGKLDLSYAVSASLRIAGVPEQRIADACVCTSCSVQDYYSYRAEGGRTGRHGAFARKGR